MKKLMIIAAAAAALLSLVSCKKDKQPEGDVTIVVTPSTVVIPGDGGSITLSVETSATSISCQVKDDCDWLKASVSGPSIILEADPNPNEEPRETELTVVAGAKSLTVPVTQQAGSKYPGYLKAQLTGAGYFGCSLYLMGKPEDADGGYAYVGLQSEDKRYFLSLEFYTGLFNSAEEVTLTPGTYTAGADDMSQDISLIVGKMLTFIPGCSKVFEDEDETEELLYGTYLVTTVGETETTAYINAGDFTVSGKEGVFTIMTNLKDENGNDVKFYYEGPIEFNTEFAVFPADMAIDPTDVSSVTCNYLGTKGDVTNLEIVLNTRNMMVSTHIPICINAVSFDDLPGTDLSGSYESSNTAGEALYAAPGAWLEYEDLKMPDVDGSYIMLGLMEFFVPDDYVNLTIVRRSNGYVVTGTFRNKFEDEWVFMDDRTEFEFEYEDASDDWGGDDDDDWDDDDW